MGCSRERNERSQSDRIKYNIHSDLKTIHDFEVLKIMPCKKNTAGWIFQPIEFIINEISIGNIPNYNVY